MVYAMYPDAAAACLERIAALCSPELRCEELLAQAYCGCVPGASEKEGEVMAGAAVDAHIVLQRVGGMRALDPVAGQFADKLLVRAGAARDKVVVALDPVAAGDAQVVVDDLAPQRKVQVGAVHVGVGHNAQL